MMVMEIMPQAMPNIVSNVRRLCAHSVARVSRNRSVKLMALRRANYCRMTCCFSLRPARISVFTPFEMPSFTLSFFLPFSSLGLGISTEENRSEEHTSELQSHSDLVCRLLLEKKNKKINTNLKSTCIHQ